MKRVMFFMLVLCVSGVVSAEIARIEVIRDATGATSEVARMRYTGTTIDYDYPGSWMMLGDHLSGANHYSDGITKFPIGGLGILPTDTINSVTLEGYFHSAGSWDGGDMYFTLSKYTTDNSSIPITLADSIEGGASVVYTTTLAFSGESQYQFNDAALTAAVTADIAAGYDYTGYVWQASAPDGTILWNGSEPHVDFPEVSGTYQLGFCGWEWGALLDSPALVIDYTYNSPPTTGLPTVEVVVDPIDGYVGSYLEWTGGAPWSEIQFPDPDNPWDSGRPYMRMGDRYGGPAYDAGVVKFELPTEIDSDAIIVGAYIEGDAQTHYVSDPNYTFVKIHRYIGDNTTPLDDPNDHPSNSPVVSVVVEKVIAGYNAFSWDVSAGVVADVFAGKSYSSYFVTQVEDAAGTQLNTSDNDPDYYQMYVTSKPQLRIVYALVPTNCMDVIESGITLDGDLMPDCVVDAFDFSVFTEEWDTCTIPGGVGCIEGDTPEPTGTIARGSCVVDADLSEWDIAEWVPIDKSIYGDPMDDVNDAVMALRWSESTNMVYAAVIVPDTTHFFTDDYDSSWDAGDRVEIFSQGDNAGGAYDTTLSDIAQQYFFGSKVAADGSHWASWAGGWPLIGTNFEGAVAVDGDEVIYEFAVQMYDNFGGRPSSSGGTVISNLESGKFVKFDVVIDTRWGFGVDDFGVLAATELENRSGDANNITEYELVEDIPCGGWGYIDADFSRNCVVDLADLSIFVLDWLVCNDPEDSACIVSW